MKIWLLNTFSIDLRILAIFRIIFFSMLFIEVFFMFLDRHVFYSNLGVFPELALPHPRQSIIGVFFFGMPSPSFTTLMFVLTLVSIFMVVIGFQTRIFNVIVFLLLVSLHTRNPFVHNGGDQIARHVVFWCMFLPIHARLAIDRIPNFQKQTHIFSIATVAILLQIFAVWFMNGLYKSLDPHWENGHALGVILRVPGIPAYLGPELAKHQSLCQILTYASLGIELICPLLILFLKKSRTFVALLLAGLHLSILLTIPNGAFQYFMLSFILLFLSDSFIINRSWSYLVQKWSVLSGLISKAQIPRHTKGWRIPIGIQFVLCFFLINIPLSNFVKFINSAHVAEFLGRSPSISMVRESTLQRYINDSLGMFQGWQFYTHVPSTGIEYVFIGTLQNGSLADPFLGRAIEHKSPFYKYLTGDSFNVLWHTMLFDYRLGSEARNHGPLLADYFCRVWNESHEKPSRMLKLQIVAKFTELNEDVSFKNIVEHTVISATCP